MDLKQNQLEAEVNKTDSIRLEPTHFSPIFQVCIRTLLDLGIKMKLVLVRRIGSHAIESLFAFSSV